MVAVLQVEPFRWAGTGTATAGRSSAGAASTTSKSRARTSPLIMSPEGADARSKNRCTCQQILLSIEVEGAYERRNRPRRTRQRVQHLCGVSGLLATRPNPDIWRQERLPVARCRDCLEQCGPARMLDAGSGLSLAVNNLLYSVHGGRNEVQPCFSSSAPAAEGQLADLSSALHEAVDVDRTHEFSGS